MVFIQIRGEPMVTDVQTETVALPLKPTNEAFDLTVRALAVFGAQKQHRKR
jgi:hypothetical protein